MFLPRVLSSRTFVANWAAALAASPGERPNLLIAIVLNWQRHSGHQRITQRNDEHPEGVHVLATPRKGFQFTLNVTWTGDDVTSLLRQLVIQNDARSRKQRLIRWLSAQPNLIAHAACCS